MEDDFGGRLSYAMNLRNMKQKELAKAVDVTEATVSRYVNNKRSPDIDFVRAVVGILHVSADYLLGFTENTDITRAKSIAEKDDEVRYVLEKKDGARVDIIDPDQVRLLDAFFLSFV